MTTLSRVLRWTGLICAFSLGISAQTGNQVDPTIDFSFSLGRASGKGVGAPLLKKYRLMPEKKVAAIFLDHLDRKLSRKEAMELASHLINLSWEYRFDPALILSVIEVESTFRTEVVSPAGAIGLMQIMPATASAVAGWLGLPYKGPESLKDPKINLHIGVAYLAHLRDRYEGLSPYYHIAAYNIGPARLDQLRSRKNFKPVKTKEYYEKIRRGVPSWRYYRASNFWDKPGGHENT